MRRAVLIASLQYYKIKIGFGFWLFVSLDTACFIKTVPSVYTLLISTNYEYL